MKVHRRGIGFVANAMAVLALLAVPAAMAQERNASDILRAMSDYVGSQQSIALSYDSSIEVITPQLEKIQFTSSGEMQLQRPDKLKARRTGGYSDVELFFDGNKVSVFAHEVNAYSQFEGPVNLDQLVEVLRAGHGVALPGADLLLSSSHDALVAGVLEEKYMGHGVIDGRLCEHLAFRNFDTDWQLWVETGEQPIPRKLVITSKTMNGAPQYSVNIKQWKVGQELAPGIFIFDPPAGAELLSPDALIEFDELPQSHMEEAQ